MPIHKTGSEWQWGEHGKKYPTKHQAEEQAAAAHANGYTGDAIASGVLFACDDKILLLKRSDSEDTFPCHWSLPGGHLEEGETSSQAAVREVYEETGRLLTFREEDSLIPLLSGNYDSFGLELEEPFTPILNEEHSEADWFPIDALPEPIHPGMEDILNKATGGRTSDRKPLMFEDEVEPGRSRFYVTEKIGKNRTRTPEGYLLCRDVPIARTGMMMYGPDETPIETGPDGLVKIFRDEDEVFSESTIASVNGKSITDEHPDDDVTPLTWKALTIGVVLNPRRGVGAYDDLLLADLLITTEEGIEAVESGKLEISCGYNADYEQNAPGVGRQRDIIMNHVALVEQGRCGPRCAIQDRKSTEEKTMAKKKTGGVFGLLRSHGVNDAEIRRALDEDMSGEGEAVAMPEGGGDVHIHIDAGGESAHEGGDFSEDENTPEKTGRTSWTDEDLSQFEQQNAAEHEEMRDRIAALETMVDQMVGGKQTDEVEAGANPEEPEAMDDESEMEKAMVDEAPEAVTPEELKRTSDSRYYVESFRSVVSDAETLVPGVKIPTFDRAANPAKTVKQLCHFRRTVLDRALKDETNQEIIGNIMGGRTLDLKSMSCGAVRTLFRSAAVMRQNANNGAGMRHAVADTAPEKAKKITLASVNKLNAEHYNK